MKSDFYFKSLYYDGHDSGRTPEDKINATSIVGVQMGNYAHYAGIDFAEDSPVYNNDNTVTFTFDRKCVDNYHNYQPATIKYNLVVNGETVIDETISMNQTQIKQYTKKVKCNFDGSIPNLVISASIIKSSPYTYTTTGLATIFSNKIYNGHIKKNNIFKCAWAWIKKSGVFKRCVIWKKINGVWKKGV